MKSPTYRHIQCRANNDDSTDDRQRGRHDMKEDALKDSRENNLYSRAVSTRRTSVMLCTPLSIDSNRTSSGCFTLQTQCQKYLLRGNRTTVVVGRRSEQVTTYLSAKSKDPNQQQQQKPFPSRWNHHRYAQYNYTAECVRH